MATSQDALMTLLTGVAAKKRVLPTEDYGFAGETPTQGELSSPFELEQTARANAADALDRKRAQDALDAQLKETDLAKQQETDTRNYELKKLLAVPQVQGANALALEREKQAGEEKARESNQALIRSLSGGTGAPGLPNEEGGHGFVPTINPAGGVTLKGIPPHKPTTEEQRALDTMGSLATLGPELLSKYEEQYPGIEKDPTKYAGLGSMLGAAIGAGAYKTGYVGNEQADQLKQLTGYLEAVLPRMLSSGRINREQYADLKLHVPQLGLSAGANYGRAKYVLDRILPAVRSAIGSQPGGASTDEYANPNYQPK